MAGKAQIIDGIAMKTELTKAQSANALDALLETITEYLAESEPVRFPGFGSFSVVERAAREGRNPRTGESILIPAKKIVRFKTGSELESQVNP